MGLPVWPARKAVPETQDRQGRAPHPRMAREAAGVSLFVHPMVAWVEKAVMGRSRDPMGLKGKAMAVREEVAPQRAQSAI